MTMTGTGMDPYRCTGKSCRHSCDITLDDCEKAIIALRVAAFDPTGGPCVGEYVRFADGVMRRISYVWPERVQISDSGSFYLDEGYMSFSGSLYPFVPTKTLTLAEETREASVWFFYHDYWTPPKDIYATVPVRVRLTSTKSAGSR
jgi:hypothetical protein